MHLEFQREVTDAHFAEIGRPYRMFRDEHWGFVAICSEFDLFAWPGRIAYEGQKLRHRVSIYSAGSYERVAVLDVRFQINDLAFHPSELLVGIATGTYDGGYMFEGELLLWDWGNNTCQSLLGESREAVRCRFDADGKMAILLHPRHEEEFEGGDPFETYVGAILDDLRPAYEIFPEASGTDPRLAELQPSDPWQWGFDTPKRSSPQTISEPDLQELKDHGFEERHLVWDLLWLSGEAFAVVHNRCHAELWHLDHGRLANFTGTGHGVELLPYSHGECLVHVIQRADWRTRAPDRSALYRLHGKTLTPFREFDHGYSFSTDSHGNILARDTGDWIRRDRVRTDRVLNSMGNTLLEADVGSFDSLNHSLRLQGGPTLFFLRGTPPASHRDKVLCSIDGDGKMRELMAWDEGETHMMSSVSNFVSDQEIIRACEVYHPRSPSRTALIERLSLKNGESFWKTPLKGCFTALTAMHSVGCAAFSQTNGILGLVELSSGRLLSQSPLLLDGVPTIATALAARRDRLLAGTIDGRLLLFRVAQQ